jgi:hypothetical protein
MHEICQSGSVGGAKPTLSLPLSPPQKSRPVGYGMIGHSEPRGILIEMCDVFLKAKCSS